MPYCENCGNELKPADQFCMKCGETISKNGKYPEIKTESSFIGNYLVVIILVALMLGTVLLAAGVLGPVFFSLRNLQNILIQYCYPAILALAVAVSAEKGPDLSIPYIAGLSAMIIALTAQTGSIALGVVLSAGICVLFGAVNGTLIGLTKIPAFIVTLAVGLLAVPIMGIMSGGETVMIEQGSVLVPVILAAAAMAAAFVVEKGFAPKDKSRQTWAQSLSVYGAGGLFASLAGYFWVMRLQVAVPRPGMGLEYVLFIYLSVTSVRWLKDSPFGLLFSLVPAFVWALLTNAFSIAGVSVFIQTFVSIAIVVVLAVIRFLLVDKKVSAQHVNRQ